MTEGHELENIFSHEVRDDADNVHDRNVNELSKYYFKKLKLSSSLEQDSNFLEDILDCLRKYSSIMGPLKRHMIMNYLNYVNTHKEFIVNFSCNELEFLYLVWKRIKHPDNKENRDKLINNLFLMILDCYEEDSDIFFRYRVKKLVCASGRVMKILSSFIHTDFDPDLGSFLTNDMLKKEFLSKISIYYGENTNKEYYEEIINEIINEYNPIHKNQLLHFKKEILNSLLFT